MDSESRTFEFARVLLQLGQGLRHLLLHRRPHWPAYGVRVPQGRICPTLGILKLTIPAAINHDTRYRFSVTEMLRNIHARLRFWEDRN